MISEAELAQMKAWLEQNPRASVACDTPLRLIREVEELRAALREIADMPHPTTHINPYRIQAIARAALGEKP